MNKLKLTTLSERILKEKESKVLLGGKCCTCSCFWESNGASSEDNKNANNARGYYSTHGCNQYYLCTNDETGMVEEEGVMTAPFVHE